MNKFYGIKVVINNNLQKVEHLVESEPFVIGSHEDADLILKINGLSRKHLKVKLENGTDFYKRSGLNFWLTAK